MKYEIPERLLSRNHAAACRSEVEEGSSSLEGFLKIRWFEVEMRVCSVCRDVGETGRHLLCLLVGMYVPLDPLLCGAVQLADIMRKIQLVCVWHGSYAVRTRISLPFFFNLFIFITRFLCISLLSLLPHLLLLFRFLHFRAICSLLS